MAINKSVAALVIRQRCNGSVLGVSFSQCPAFLIRKVITVDDGNIDFDRRQLNTHRIAADQLNGWRPVNWRRAMLGGHPFVKVPLLPGLPIARQGLVTKYRPKSNQAKPDTYY